MGLSVLLAVQVAPPGGILRLLSVSVEQPAPLDELDADELPDDVDSQSLLLLPVAGDVVVATAARVRRVQFRAQAESTRSIKNHKFNTLQLAPHVSMTAVTKIVLKFRR